MGVIVSHNEVINQSKQVWKQFGESKWIPFAKENAKLERRNANELKGCGVGKFLVLAAMGESLEEQIPVLKKYQDRVDIITCDKGFVPLLKAGIRPKYVMVCDANVRYAHVEDYVQETKDIILLATPYAHTVWTTMWKGPRYFYVNKDSIKSEEVFLPIMGQDSRVIPASSNVSNAMFVFMTGCDERNQNNWAGYEKYFLIGYDYCWRPNGNYYAYGNPYPKNAYMTHRFMLDTKGTPVRTSENLFFSMKWLYSYITTYNIPAVNCSNRGILGIPMQSTLEQELGRINPSARAREAVRRSYDVAQLSSRNFEAAKEMFMRSREELCLSETMQKSA
jgi:hypothetical protein